MFDETKKFPEGRRIPGYGEKYLIREDGKVFRQSDEGPGYVEVKASGEPPRVRLYRLGRLWRPYVHTLIQRVFGEEE